jgi:hypothetical protein
MENPYQKSIRVKNLTIRILLSVTIFWTIFGLGIGIHDALTNPNPTCGFIETFKCSRLDSFKNGLEIWIMVLPLFILTTPFNFSIVLPTFGASAWIGCISGLIPALSFYVYSAKWYRKRN